MDVFQIEATTPPAKRLWTNIQYYVDGDKYNKAETKSEGQDNLCK